MLSGSLCYQLSPKLQALPQIHTLAWSHTHTHTQTLNIHSHTHTQRSSDTDTQSSGHSVVCVFVDFPLCLFKTEQFPRSFTPFLTTVAASQSIWHDFPVVPIYSSKHGKVFVPFDYLSPHRGQRSASATLSQTETMKHIIITSLFHLQQHFCCPQLSAQTVTFHRHQQLAEARPNLMLNKLLSNCFADPQREG